MAQGQRTIQSVENSCRLIEELRSIGPASVTELANRMDLAPGTVHTHLTTLKHYGLVHQNGTAYQLGPAFLTYGEYVRMQMAIYQAGRDVTEEIAFKCDAAAHLFCEHQGELIIVDEAFGKEAIAKDYYYNQRDSPVEYYHCSSAGKAILAHLPEDKVDRLLDEQGMPELTPNTITDRDELNRELESIRSEGIAYNDEERIKGIRAIGAPILHDFDQVLGALSVSGPSMEWREDQFRYELPKLLTRAVNEIEVKLQADLDLETTLNL